MSMHITDLVRSILSPRLRSIDQSMREAERVQSQRLAWLIERGEHTEWGKLHGLRRGMTYEEFQAACPVSDYNDLRGFIERMRRGERDVLWTGRVTWFAKSSGTTLDKSKYIPVSREGLRDTHYRGGTDAVALYLREHPDSRMFDGRSLILGGSHERKRPSQPSLSGDLSAVMIENINPLVNLFRTPSKRTALLADFSLKRQLIARETIRQNVTNLSGVPSWMLSVLRAVADLAGKETIAEVWPNLEVFFHGGVAFAPYRSQYDTLIGNPSMRYMETYNASEGFFGIQGDSQDKAMNLMTDYGVFYEFIPTDALRQGSTQAVPLGGVETGRDYAMVITTSCGLWRYVIGDTLTFTSRDPYKFVITGRTKSFINAFGEELIVDNAEKGLIKACQQTGAEVVEYTAAPVYMDSHGRCRHQWLIEFAHEPKDMVLFARLLDEALQSLNSDYEAKRRGDLTLQAPEITVARRGLFDDWLSSKGRLGGQHKIPRLANDRGVMDSILSLDAGEGKR